MVDRLACNQSIISYQHRNMTDTWPNIKFTSERQRAMVNQLYNELKQVKGFQNLQLHQNETLNVVYLTGRLEGRLNDDLFIPLGTTQMTTMKEIVRIQEQLLEYHGVKSLKFAFMDEDSTTVYYQLTPGFVPPPAGAPIELEL